MCCMGDGFRLPWDEAPHCPPQSLSLSPNTFLPAPLQAFAHIKGHCVCLIPHKLLLHTTLLNFQNNPLR